VVIGFPSDQFKQEPETNETMVKACLINFGVTFLISEKINVNGKDTHPLFVYLKKELPGGILGSNIKWNFTKFLVSKEGVPFKHREAEPCSNTATLIFYRRIGRQFNIINRATDRYMMP
jgi:glutathione peroxidase-family protein